MNNVSNKTTGLVQLSLFAAIIVMLAVVPGLGYIPIGVINATTIHIPVIIGAILLGPKKGAFLGFVFGFTSMIRSTMVPGVTAFIFSPYYAMTMGGIPAVFKSLLICFVPRILIGIVPYFVFHGIRKLLKNTKTGLTVSLVIAGLAGSLTNTILVMNFIYFLFADSYAQAIGIAVDVLYTAILTIITTNGIVEAIVASAIVAGVCRVFFKSKILSAESRLIAKKNVTA